MMVTGVLRIAASGAATGSRVSAAPAALAWPATALVTGAGRGIGRAIAIGLGRRGVRVGLLARTQRDLDDVAAEIRDDGGTAIALAADIGDAGGYLKSSADNAW